MFVPPNFLNGLFPLIRAYSSDLKIRHTSTLFFIHHKCASTFFNRLFSATYGYPFTRNIKFCNYSSCISAFSKFTNFSTKYKFDEEFFERVPSELFYPYSHLYGPLRRPFSFDGQDSFKKIFVIRNPLDRYPLQVLKTHRPLIQPETLSLKVFLTFVH